MRHSRIVDYSRIVENTSNNPIVGEEMASDISLSFAHSKTGDKHDSEGIDGLYTLHGNPDRPFTFVDLPPELRLQIWDAVLQARVDEPQVINILVKPFNPKRFFGPPSRLTVLNKAWLRANDGSSNLLGTNYEARTVAQVFLASHPYQRSHPWSGTPGVLQQTSRRGQKWMGLYWLGRLLERLRIDPERDVLFLNGLDLHPDYAVNPPVKSNCQQPSLLLPEKFGEWMSFSTLQFRHSLQLEDREVDLTSQFRTIIMPVEGLVKQGFAGGSNADDRGLCSTIFRDPMRLPINGPRDRPGARTERTFVALIGHYRGRNLQMADLEFVSHDEINKIKREGWEPGQRMAKSVLQRDVLVMEQVWRHWITCMDWENDTYGYSRVRRLRYARVRQKALDRLAPDDLYWADDVYQHKADREGGGER